MATYRQSPLFGNDPEPGPTPPGGSMADRNATPGPAPTQRRRNVAGDEAHQRFLARTGGRQLFARDLDRGATLFYLRPGQADAHRERGKAGRLRCPVSDCGAKLTTVAHRSRHHLRHPPGGAAIHSAETIEHHTAKHLLGQWRPGTPEATASRKVGDLDRES